MQTVTIDLRCASLTRILDTFRHCLAAEVARLSQEDGITLNAEVVTQVLTTLDVLSTATHAQGA